MESGALANLLSGLIGAVVGSVISIGYTAYLSSSNDTRKRRAIAAGMMNEVSIAQHIVWRSYDRLKLPTLDIGAERVSLSWTSRFVEFAELFDAKTVGLVHDFNEQMDLFNALADAMRQSTNLEEAKRIRKQQEAVIDLLLPRCVALTSVLSSVSKYEPVGRYITVDPKAGTIFPDTSGRIDVDDTFRT